MTDENAQDNAKAIAEAHLTEGNFSFLEHLASREMPTDVVDIYLDEAAGHRINKLEVDRLMKAGNDDQVAIINTQIEHEIEKAQKSHYKVHLTGITNDVYDAIIDEAEKEFPYEYTESRNPLTMKTERNVVFSEKRQTFFRVHYWAASIVKIEGPDGRVDDNITPEFAAILNAKAPVIALARIQGAIDELRMASDWMDKLAGDDFLAKS